MSLEDLKALSHADWQARAAALRPCADHFIDGEFVASADGRRFESRNPADGSLVAEVARGGAAEIDRAVAAARRAFRDPAWAGLAPRARMALLWRFAEKIEAEAAELALLDSLEMGKPIADLLAVDLPQVLETLRYFAEAIDKVEGKVTATDPAVLHYVLRQPLGVVGCISPWNYPLLMAVWKIAPALAAGNCVVLKPAEQASLSCLRLGALFAEAGGPPGVLSVVAGYGEEAGQALARHPQVAKLSFTGSAEVGRKILVYAGESNMKRVGLECGGKSPQVIFADVAEPERAVEAAIAGIYGNMGEVCNAGSRLLVERGLHDRFVEAFAARGPTAYRAGDPLDPATSLGPLVSPEAQRRVLGYVEAGRREGARLVFGGGVPAGLDAGAYVEPTLFAGVDNAMTIAREEIFGPVAAVIPFEGAEQALAIANDSIYGLAASVWTRDLATAHRLVRDLEAGVVWVNCFDEGDMTQPFGGWKQSGNARDKCFESLLEYTQLKSAWLRLG